jgi:hypothetical protein
MPCVETDRASRCRFLQLIALSRCESRGTKKPPNAVADAGFGASTKNLHGRGVAVRLLPGRDVNDRLGELVRDPQGV